MTRCKNIAIGGLLATTIVLSSGVSVGVASAAVATNGYARLTLTGGSGGWNALGQRQSTSTGGTNALGHLQITGPGVNRNNPDQANYKESISVAGRGAGTVCVTHWTKYGGGYQNIGSACLNV